MSWRAAALLLLALPLTGCAYYNGMYNANRFAKKAQKAERQGRSFEAQGYWAQAEVRADTVIARHPTSQYVDDAQLIRGESMVARGDCGSAIPALEQASLSLDSPQVVERAHELLGRCRLQAGDYQRADQSFVALLESGDSARRASAEFNHARIQRTTGDYAGALATLGLLSGPQVDAERAAAYAGLGQLDDALPLVDAALARGDLAVPWDSILAGIGRVDPAAASRYTTAVVQIPGLPAEARDQLLMADGLRLLAADPDSGLARLQRAASADPVTDAALAARLRLAEYTLASAGTIPQLEAAREPLVELGEIGGRSSVQALHYVRVLDKVKGYADSVTTQSPLGDLATFVVAEAVRDSLPAPQIATQLFASIPAAWPASPYAPKALLAMAALQPERAEEIVQQIQAAYPDSPYLLLAEGQVTPAVLALEDSLQRYAGAGAARATPGNRRPAQPGARQPAGQRPPPDELK